MGKEKDLVAKLRKEYSDSEFYIKSSKEEIEILYSNEKYINNDDFLDNIYDIASEFLSEDELWSLVISYDLFNERPNFGLELSQKLMEIQDIKMNAIKRIEISNDLLNVFSNERLKFKECMNINNQRIGRSIGQKIMGYIKNKIPFEINTEDYDMNSNDRSGYMYSELNVNMSF